MEKMKYVYDPRLKMTLWKRTAKDWDFIVGSIFAGMLLGFVIIIWLILWVEQNK